MIVYETDNVFFAMKNDAERRRKALGLPPSATIKYTINDRAEMVDLLNGIIHTSFLDGVEYIADDAPPFDEDLTEDEQFGKDMHERMKKW